MYRSIGHVYTEGKKLKDLKEETARACEMMFQ